MARLAKAAASLHDEIVANSKDRSNWGPAKHFVMAAQDAGVDISEPGALEAFMLQFNLKQIARSRTAHARQSPWPLPSALLTEDRNSRPPVAPYDPCPCGSGRKYKFCCKQKD